MVKNYYQLYKKYKSKYFKLKNMVGGNVFENSFSYNEIKDLECGDNCKIDNGKIKEIKLKEYRVVASSNKITLYDNFAKYSEFSIDNFNIHFGYLIEMIKMIEDILNVNKRKGNIKKYSILILGFGLGGACLNLSKYNEFFKIDSIDLDYDLFKLFKKITLSNNIQVSPKINYIHGDAVDYLKHCKNQNIKYDFILDDIFISSNKIDYDFSIVYDCLNSDGIFFMNVHYTPKEYVDILKKDNYKHVGYIPNNEYLIYAKN